MPQSALDDFVLGRLEIVEDETGFRGSRGGRSLVTEMTRLDVLFAKGALVFAAGM